MFRADTSHQAVGLAQQSDQSAFENSPVASKAGATTTTRKILLDERNDNAEFGKDGHQNYESRADRHARL